MAERKSAACTVAGGEVTVEITDLGVQTDGVTPADDSWYSQLSAMLVDDEGNVIAYGKIADAAQTGEITFPIPESTEKGMYRVMIFAEKINSSAASALTDYASNLVEIPLRVVMTQEGKMIKNINLNTDGIIPGIADPKAAEGFTGKWEGSKVYFGSYAGQAVLYRVLDSYTSDYREDGEEKTMFLDCDSILNKINFNEDRMADDANVWESSALRTWMNGTEEGQFLAELSKLERASILSSVRAEDKDLGTGSLVEWCPLTGDQVFALDAKELTNHTYGYSSYDGRVNNGACPNRAKQGQSAYWLRSLDTYVGSTGKYIGIAKNNGDIGVNVPDINSSNSGTSGYGASPALNVRLSSVLMASAIGAGKTELFQETGADQADNNIWKLTLKDETKSVAVTENKKIFLQTEGEDTQVTVPFTYQGYDVSQISVMITDQAYDGKNPEVLCYGKLETEASSFGVKEGSGTGTFVQPQSLKTEQLGEDYHMYLLAEEASEGGAVDYASLPREVAASDIGDKISAVTIMNPADSHAVWQNDDKNGAEQQFCSGAMDAVVYHAPEIGIDFEQELLTGLEEDAAYIIEGEEVHADGTAIPILEDWMGTTIAIVKLCDENESYTNTESEPQQLFIPSRFREPDVTAVNETVNGKKDGKIQGIYNAMEYRLSGETEWIAADQAKDMEIGGLAAGTYEVRFQRSSVKFARKITKAVIGYDAEAVRSLQVRVPAFANVVNGYAQPQAEKIILTNTGNMDASITSAVLTGTDADAFILMGAGGTVAEGESIDAWMIQPKAGLKANADLTPKTYRAVLTVVYNGTEETAVTEEVSITVSPAAEEIAAAQNTAGSQQTQNPTDSQQTQNPADSQQTQNPPANMDHKLPKKGQSVTDKKSAAVYKVTKADHKNGTVEYVKPVSKKASSITVPDVIKINGDSYKVTSIAKTTKKSKK